MAYTGLSLASTHIFDGCMSLPFTLYMFMETEPTEKLAIVVFMWCSSVIRKLIFLSAFLAYMPMLLLHFHTSLAWTAKELWFALNFNLSTNSSSIIIIYLRWRWWSNALKTNTFLFHLLFSHNFPAKHTRHTHSTRWEQPKQLILIWIRVEKGKGNIDRNLPLAMHM